MKIVVRALFGLAVLIVLAVLGGFLLPAQVHLEREIVIHAPAATIFPYVNDLRKWDSWSPWHELEPTADYKYSGADSGVGQVSEWKHANVARRQSIVASVPNSSINTDLDFGRQGAAKASWKFEEDAGKTKVIWGLDIATGMNPINRYMAAFLIEPMVGEQYEQGLNSLKEVCEASMTDDKPTDRPPTERPAEPSPINTATPETN